MIHRDAALAVLKDLKPQFAERYGTTALGIFGSVAREQATGVSDVDVVVKMSEPNLFTWFTLKNPLKKHSMNMWMLFIPGRG